MTHIFVGGAQRSGTTLLATLLCAGPETNPYLGESSGLRSLLESYDMMRKRFADEGVTHFGSRAVLDTYFRSTLLTFFSLVMATNAPASRLVLKEPHLTLYFPHLFLLTPGSRFVLIKRDPRDVVVSMLKVGKRMADEGKPHLYNESDVATVAGHVMAYYRPVFNAARLNRRFAAACSWVQYETLVTEPEKVMAQLREQTGLSLKGVDPYNPGKHRQNVAELQDAERLKPWVTDIQASGELSTKAIGGYRDYLSPEDLLTVEKATCHLIRRFGYSFETQEAAELAQQPEAE